MHWSRTEKKEKLIDLIALNSIEGIGVNRLHQLIGAFGSAADIFKASINDLTDVPGIGRETASNIARFQNRKETENIVDKIIRLGWNVFIYDEPDYPDPLKSLKDKPPYLFYLGEYNSGDSNAIAIVGSRSASEEGRLFATRLAGDLATSSITVISGLARGIDISAHRGALASNGRTIAVFGSSLEITYPPEGRELVKKIIQSGCIFSEFLPGTQPYGENFPKRNRIISGLAQGVVVIEAATRSGALSTARHALKQNREVFAVPGPPRQETSAGTNRLIKDGAVLLTSVEDIFNELPRLKGHIKSKKMEEISDLTETERKIISLFSGGPLHIDNISRSLDTPVSELMQVLLAMELKGIIKELSGKRFILE